jgi:ribosome-associated protein
MCLEVGLKRPKTEGLENASWVLQDFFDVVVHIMLKGTRHYYKIEKLWADAKFYQNSLDGKLKAIKELEVFNLLKENELARI